MYLLLYRFKKLKTILSSYFSNIFVNYDFFIIFLIFIIVFNVDNDNILNIIL
ncbi:hypothetical protein HMPREF1871_01189 [Gemelliphila asaccharolytica]|uniref:Uncharacterized protein n=1 Tax=Gemelliphila asaccharolytica TaxID=502393 RepID=A0ABR5TKE4_9BACL|nr:hypothetical protein HMPREF1871_01189 [Gemella asaccharolytica]